MQAGEPSGETKNTVYVSGLGREVDSQALYAAFLPFGDVLDVQIPKNQGQRDGRDGGGRGGRGGRGGGRGGRGGSGGQRQIEDADSDSNRGFGFVTFSQNSDALEAIDNMHLNELNGRTIKCNIAKPSKAQMPGNSNRAIWEDEAWLKNHNRPLGESAAADKQPQQDEEEE